MKRIKYAIPPTTDQGPVTIIGTASATETPAQNALWQYNKMREHDGQPPLSRLPNGTRKITKDSYLYNVCADYGHGHGLEIVCTEESYIEAKLRRKEYLENDREAQRIVIRRERRK